MTRLVCVRCFSGLFFFSVREVFFSQCVRSVSDMTSAYRVSFPAPKNEITYLTFCGGKKKRYRQAPVAITPKVKRITNNTFCGKQLFFSKEKKIAWRAPVAITPNVKRITNNTSSFLSDSNLAGRARSAKGNTKIGVRIAYSDDHSKFCTPFF